MVQHRGVDLRRGLGALGAFGLQVHIDLAALQPHFMCDYDETQAIGRRYRRQDELGTPYCVTVDFDSLEDRAVTVRDRDTMAQERVPIEDLLDHLRPKLDV